MRLWAVCLVGLGLGLGAAASSREQVLGQVRLSDGWPVAEARVMLFDLADLRRGAVAQATTDASGQFALPLVALGGAVVRPEGFALGQSFPNPFNPSTNIPYELATAAHVRLEVFDILGQRIATLVDGEQAAGAYRARWDGTNAAGQAVAAGVYIYRLRVGGAHQAGRMVLIDGQAGRPMGGASVETWSVADARVSAYGLVVSGEGLVAYVDSDFDMVWGMGPVEIEVQARDGVRMKVAQTQRLLGDVDNNGRVNIADALLVTAYSIDNSIAMPNNGDISLGDVNEDGRIDIVDAWLLETYSTNPSDPIVPSGIGQPVASDVGQTAPPDNHGDTQSAATQINVGSATNGYLSAGDIDYFQVEVDDLGTGTLRAYTTGSTNTYGNLYNSSGDTLASNDDLNLEEGFSRLDKNFHVSAQKVGRSTYYIEIRGHTEGSYTLHVRYEPGFNIELVFLPDDNNFAPSLTRTQADTVKKVVRQAAARWESVITGDLPDVDYSSNPFDITIAPFDTTIASHRIRVGDVVDDIRLYVYYDSSASVTALLASAGPLDCRNSSLLPAIGRIKFYKSSLSDSYRPNLKQIVLHEMAHALGFTHTVWSEKGLLRGKLWDETLGLISGLIKVASFESIESIVGVSIPEDAFGVYVLTLLSSLAQPMAIFEIFDRSGLVPKDFDVSFEGRQAIQAFDDAGGSEHGGEKVPVENDRGDDLFFARGTEWSHWRASVFSRNAYSELMVGSFASYMPLSAITIQSFADLGYQVDVSQADPYFVVNPSAKPVADHSLELMDCSLKGPIRVVDENGRVVRTIGE